MLSGKDAIDLYHFGAGHTNGDTFVVFRALRTMHAGDMFPWKDAPFIDRSNGGSGVEWPKSIDKVLKNVKNVDTVIGGHQPVATWKDLQTYQQYTADLLAAIGSRAEGRQERRRCDRVAELEQVRRLRNDAPQGRGAGDLRRAEQEVDAGTRGLKADHALASPTP